MSGWADNATAAKKPSKPPPVYPDAATWLRDWFAPRWARSWDSGARVWCPTWHQHPEAVSRVEGLWRAWEHLTPQNDTGLSAWWRDHADPHMAALTAHDGPFQRCAKGHTDRLAPLPLEDSGVSKGAGGV